MSHSENGDVSNSSPEKNCLLSKVNENSKIKERMKEKDFVIFGVGSKTRKNLI